MIVAQAQHRIQNRGAQGGIDHRHRLIGHNQTRFNHIGARHHNSLSLAAA